MEGGLRGGEQPSRFGARHIVLAAGTRSTKKKVQTEAGRLHLKAPGTPCRGFWTYFAGCIESQKGLKWGGNRG